MKPQITILRPDLWETCPEQIAIDIDALIAALVLYVPIVRTKGIDATILDLLLTQLGSILLCIRAQANSETGICASMDIIADAITQLSELVDFPEKEDAPEWTKDLFTKMDNKQ
jgi:hypothetical protein